MGNGDRRRPGHCGQALTAVAKILEAIYEADFLPCSYGYRPGVGALDAVRELSRALEQGLSHYEVEADIQGFFDHAC